MISLNSQLSVFVSSTATPQMRRVSWPCRYTEGRIVIVMVKLTASVVAICPLREVLVAETATTHLLACELTNLSKTPGNSE